MSWLLLIVAGLLEVAWASTLKSTEGLTRPLPTAFFLAALAGSMILLARATQTIPLGTAYTVWVGIGAAGATIAGIALYSDPFTWPRMFFLMILILGIVGLKVTGS
ncbi:MAG: multidrug efflux SMR transporter [Thermomicrobiales bacterium]